MDGVLLGVVQGRKRDRGGTPHSRAETVENGKGVFACVLSRGLDDGTSYYRRKYYVLVIPIPSSLYVTPAET